MKKISSIIFLFLSFHLYGKENHHQEFQTILDSLGLKGTIVVYVESLDTYYSNDFEWATKGFIPASTYKIPNTIIALELGTVKDENELFVWDGQKRRFPQWEKDLTLLEAFKVSCVPCYQEIARRNGLQNMKQKNTLIQYGKMKICKKNLDQFWLTGKSKISPMQEIDFLRRFQRQQLPVSKQTYEIMKKIMIHTQTEDYIIRAKTGWGEEKGKDLGWFVGYVEKRDKIYYFATCVQPKDATIENFGEKRIQGTFQALQSLGIID